MNPKLKHNKVNKTFYELIHLSWLGRMLRKRMRLKVQSQFNGPALKFAKSGIVIKESPSILLPAW